MAESWHPSLAKKKIHWATYPQAITDSSCLSSPTSTWIINKCLEKKHLFLQIIYRESIHYLQLGYYPKLWAPGLFNSLACSMAWRNFKGDPWSLEIVPPACAAKVLKKVVSWHQSLGDGGLDCYDQRDRYFAHTENQFSSLLWLSKNWRLWFNSSKSIWNKWKKDAYQTNLGPSLCQCPGQVRHLATSSEW